MDPEGVSAPSNLDTLLTAAAIALPLPAQPAQDIPGARERAASVSSPNSQPDTTPPQNTMSGSKRTKVSRACDECRRKKIRCDIEARGNSCSSCQRANASCTFSRVQLKRGPSKRSRSHSEVLQGQRLFTQEQLPGINSLLSWRPEAVAQSQMSHVIAGQSPHPAPSPVYPSTGGPGVSPNQSHASPPASSRGQNPTINGQSVKVEQQSSWPARTSPQIGPHDVPSPQGVVNTPAPPPASASPAMMMAQHNRRSSLPVLTPTHAFDLDPFALSHYYQYWHPVFPILPDGPNSLHQLLALAPAIAPWLIAAINGQLYAMPIDPQQCVNDTQRAIQLMALMFIYLRTLDYTWLGAVVANAIAIKNNGGGHGTRLYYIALVFDRMHSLTHHYPQLIRDDGVGGSSKAAMEPMQRELKLLELANKECCTPPPEPYEAAMAAFWWLGNLEGTPSAKAELSRLLPALLETPVAGFVRKALS